MVSDLGGKKVLVPRGCRLLLLGLQLLGYLHKNKIISHLVVCFYNQIDVEDRWCRYQQVFILYIYTGAFL